MFHLFFYSEINLKGSNLGVPSNGKMLSYQLWDIFQSLASLESSPSHVSYYPKKHTKSNQVMPLHPGVKWLVWLQSSAYNRKTFFWY